MIFILHFAPLPWVELQKNGYRKTSGAMLRALRERSDVAKIWYVQQDRRWGFRSSVQRIDSKVTVVGLPIGLPYERIRPIRWFNRRLQAWLLKSALFKRGSNNRLVYWFYDWWNIEIISHLPQACTVMEVTDLASHFVRSTRQEQLSQVKGQVLDIVDYLFPVSVALKSECSGAKGKVTVLPNGIGRDFLEQARERQPEPTELQLIPHPRLCVVSTGWPLNYRLDHELLWQVLELLPEWHLILIGCEKVESPALRKLIQHPRVTTINLIPLRNLIAFIQHCDVCAAPYPREVAKAGDSLKVYEYLACGKPVILSSSQGHPELQRYLRFAFEAEKFAQSCQELFQSPAMKSEELETLLNKMTWERRADTCLSIINDGRLEPGVT